MIDSHCHLDYPELFNDLDNVILRASNNRIKHMLTISTTLESYEKIKIIVNKYKNVFGTLGIHPHESTKNMSIKYKDLIKLKDNNNKIIGIGETGLDFYYNHSEKENQKQLFIEHINAAIELNVPIIVHTRNAEKETEDILYNEMKNSKLNTLIHCFTGSKEFAHKLIDMGCFISLSGIITFKNSQNLINTIKTLPLEKLMIETDSPYLSPVPFRGKANEPSYLKYTAEKLSLIKGVNVDKITQETTKNFFKLFKININ
jgi:TatD DNase family protein